MRRILLVDDEPNVLEGLKRLLRVLNEPHTCEGVTSGRTALEEVRRTAFDVIVLDVSMPEMDGIEVLARLKADPETQHIPVLMLTGRTEPQNKRAALDLGAHDFLNKPADPHELVARLTSALRMKSFQDRLQQQNKMLKQQLLRAQRLELVGLLAGGVVHDLNNILAGISGHVELAAVKVGGEPEIQENLKHALSSVKHAARLVQQILSLGRSSTLRVEEHDLATLIDESLELICVIIPEDVQVIWEKPCLNATVRLDPTQLHQLLLNLVTNAVRAISGSGRLTITLEQFDLSARAAELGNIAPGRFLRLDVADTGSGMEPAVLQQIFEPFYSTKEHDQKSGIGLSVVQTIVRDHGGSITADSTPGQGSTFHVYLPCASEETVLAQEKEEGGSDVREETNPVCG